MRTIHGFSFGAECAESDNAFASANNTRPPLSAWQAAAALTQRGDLAVSDSGVFWLEFDPALGGAVIVGLSDRGITRPAGSLQVRSRVNGYGGGALCAGAGCLYAVSEQQQVVRVGLDDCSQRVLLTTESGAFGGLVADTGRSRVLAVREGNACQQLVAMDDAGHLSILHQGQDFYSAPALSPDGRKLAWVSWQLPDMPWIQSTLWTAEINDDGSLYNTRAWAPPVEASVQQPVFYGEDLWLFSDHEGWWQPYRFLNQDRVGVWSPTDAPTLDHANAPWQLGERHHCGLPGGGWARVRYRQGVAELWLQRLATGAPERRACHFTDFRCIQSVGDHVYCVARSDVTLDAVLKISATTGELQVLAGGEVPWETWPVVRPQNVFVPADSGGRLPVQGFLYRPEPMADELPPLILIAHGGPTSAAYPVFNPQIQFWCQRGFAVAEINYRGSTGFGRAFRMALAGRWGEADVEDMGRAANHLAHLGLVDGDRVFIQGRSSGGYTALMALVLSDRFAGGASLYGVTDPLRLRAATHRFESGYLDWLLGPPEAFPERWQDRTPLNRAASINAPVVFFQGGLDQVVVPEQTRAMVGAIRATGGAPELHWFDGEGHGFRQQSSQAGAMEWLCSFYRKHGRNADVRADNLS
ncbi:alpha/beta hydrolase family protein [Marinobacter sp. F4218]|uniref:alpha/beta hydrolase family protein n=1 Tax=Marinobacter sp. F4218 TaxID=2862868 RepID=UPI001C630DB5|nr:prolyl oligopeptidase family serine peptidase [Marinobacter sp. F4218]MBW7471196.1 prolyl oligopeptidase family serine peptidase [Marinobacter sp. F4218]